MEIDWKIANASSNFKKSTMNTRKNNTLHIQQRQIMQKKNKLA